MSTQIVESFHEPMMAYLGISINFVVLFIIYKVLKMRSKERLSLIEKGMDPSLARPKLDKNPLNYLKYGLLLIGMALGVVSGYLLNLFFDIPEFVAYSAMILLFCGLLLLYFYKSNNHNL